MSKKKPGRPPGAKWRRNKGLFKKCDCRRRDWWTCGHPVYMNFRNIRINLNKHAQWPAGKNMSKTDADALRANIVKEITAGTFRSTTSRAATDRLTFRDVTHRYLDAFKQEPDRRAPRVKKLEWQLALLCRTEIPGAHGQTLPMGDKPFPDFVLGDIDAFRDARRAIMREKDRLRQERRKKIAEGDTKSASAIPVSTETPRSRKGEIGINRHLEVIRLLFNWGIRKGYYQGENPFVRFGKSMVDFAEEKARDRRLQGDEEERLLNHAGRHLRALIIAAIDTGCRKGELLALQWKHVVTNAKGQATKFALPAEITKMDRARDVQVSPRLRAVLEMRKHGPDGTEHGPEAYVFGNEFGEQQDSIKLAWQGTCRRAGITGLNFHDLRRESGSRMVEDGVNILAVRNLLGHKRVTTTDTYLRASERVAEKEITQYHARRARNNPRITLGPKSKPPGEGKRRITKPAKSMVSRTVS